MLNNSDNKLILNNIKEKKTDEIEVLIHKKVNFFKDIIQKTLIYVQKNKIHDILGVNDIVICLDKLTELSNKINEIKVISKSNFDANINILQSVNNDLSLLFKNYGTESLNDLLFICFGNNKIIDNNQLVKFELLQKYFHPTGYKVINKKDIKKNKVKTNEDIEINENTKNLDCFDAAINFKQFHLKVYGIKVYIHNEESNKTLIIYGVLDEVIIRFLNNSYILEKQKQILENIPITAEFDKTTFNNFVESLILKDYLIYDNNGIYSKFIGYLNQINNIKQKTMSQTIKDFISDDIYYKRLTLIQLLINSDNYDNQYLAYLLYDLLTNDTNNTNNTHNNIDTQEQTIIFDSFPWFIKRKFLHSMKNTVQYTNELSNFDMNKIPLEQQICLMKASDSVKEKAMLKLKELKNKTEDSGSKARQYLEGLLKIPFGIYKKEPILSLMDHIKKHFLEIHHNMSNNDIPYKEKYSSMEIFNYVDKLNKKYNKPIESNSNKQQSKLLKSLINCDKNQIIINIGRINEFLINNKITYDKIKCSNKKKNELNNEIEKVLIYLEKEYNKKDVFLELEQLFLSKTNNVYLENNKNIKNDENKLLDIINTDLKKINDYMTDVKMTLDNAVYGHDKAKKQIEIIIGQWINGKHDGYCFGFEGPPGVGKTSLAKKGLSDCLKDEKGVSRPFAMIQMGGESNGSTLHGHNYTYVGSTWGSIVQILIDKKCMNPIIFIDEVDKISKTEHGREIVGILTHLLDSTQNDCFQDKYFTGVDLDLSKALFILSYNDADAIDKILLDRIHRIKFKNLSLEDKIVISRSHILPEIYKKMGLENVIEITDEVLNFLINEYTQEAGVRKLKELLFEIVGEINLHILKNSSNNTLTIPLNISINDIKNKYLTEKQVVQKKHIHNNSVNNIINGMYANSLGLGGILPFQCCFTPAKHFLEIILTGNQQEVMKEGMILSKNLAWNLTNEKIQKDLIKKYNDYKKNCIYGININALGLSVPKDGPSASSTITVLIYALLNNKKIKNYFAMTGEVSLDGNITEIGGLEHKILGSLKSLVTSFIFPKENEKDFHQFMKKYKDDELVKKSSFYPVETIQEVFELIFEKD
jgi:ATP-dependent Lon protease